MADDKIPAPGTDEYNAYMIAKADAGMSEIRVTENGPDGKPVTQVATQEPVKEGEQTPANQKPQRPDNVPEKFWDAEKGVVKYDDVLKSYVELEKSKSKPEPAKTATPAAPAKSDAQKAAEAELTAAQAEATAAADDAAKTAAKAKVDAAQAKLNQANEAAKPAPVNMGELVQKASEQFAADGKLSEETYASLEAAGLSREYVDTYVEGIQARAEVVTQKVYGEAGGQDNYKLIQEWATTNLSPEQVQAANAAFDSGDLNKIIGQVRSLKSLYEAANGKQGKARVDGGGGNTTAGNPYQNGDECKKDMRDPKYRNDPKFRAAVQSRIDASMKANIDLGF